MKAKLHDFTVDASPTTTWRVRVVVWRTLKQLLRARGGDDPNCCAFCFQFSAKDAHKDGIIADIHFHRRETRPGVVAHEATHAALAYARMAKLNLETESGEEAFAESVEHITAGALFGIGRRK